MLKILEIIVQAINALFDGGDSTVKFDPNAEPGSLCAPSKFSQTELSHSKLGEPSEFLKPSKLK